MYINQNSYIFKPPTNTECHSEENEIDLISWWFEEVSFIFSFFIVVNRLYFGCSVATWKLIACCLLVNLVVLKLAIPPLTEWLNGLLLLDEQQEGSKAD